MTYHVKGRCTYDGRTGDDTTDIYPTAKQYKAAMKHARDEAYACLETALASLDDAKRHFAFLSDDNRYQDCGMAMATVEDLKDSMEDTE